MKTFIHFKTVLIYSVVALGATIGTMSCSNTPKVEDTKKVAEEHNEAKFETKSTEKDAQYLVNVAEINLEEIKLGQLAQQKATMAHVKELGKMMETAHTKAMGDLSAMAAKKMVTIPATATADVMDAYKKMSDLKGNKFDKEYCDKMVNGHKDAISKVEKISTDATDPEIKQWAMAVLPELRMHLDHSLTCQKKTEKMAK